MSEREARRLTRRVVRVVQALIQAGYLPPRVMVEKMTGGDLEVCGGFTLSAWVAVVHPIERKTE